jgi:hypothetical protein
LLDVLDRGQLRQPLAGLMPMRRAVVSIMLLAASVFGPSRAARGDEAYYVIVFGSEPTPKRLRDSHTWVSYVRVVGQGADPAGWQVANVHTISWVPASKDVRIYAPHPEPGINLDLARTFEFVYSCGASVDVWAPIRVSPQLYQASVIQWGRLQRGEVLYQAIDPPGDHVYDCIHANTALDPRYGQSHYPLVRVGKSASAYLVKQLGMRDAYFNPYEDATWILSALGIDRYPVRVMRPAIVVR